MKKHIIGILIAAFVIALATVPLVYWLFDYVGARIYSSFILPEMAILSYIAYNLFLDGRYENK